MKISDANERSTGHKNEPQRGVRDEHVSIQKDLLGRTISQNMEVPVEDVYV
jgi:hypothetical protein